MHNPDSANNAREGNIPFPQIPDQPTMVLQNLTKQPTFFGCNDSAPTPLVLYLPNAPWSAYSNFSFEKPAFTDIQFQSTVDNAFNVATYGNGTVDPEWPQCLACAVIRGAMARSGQQMPDQCTQCFQRHCWNGTSSTGQVTLADYDLSPRLNQSLTFREWNETVWYSEGAGASSGGGGDGSGSGGSGQGSLAALSAEYSSSLLAVSLLSVVAMLML